MPHLVILYTKNLDTEVDMSALCRRMADTMLTVKDEDGKQVYPTGGTRVLAYPAAHSAVADGGAAGKAAGGDGDYAFVYLNLRMAKDARMLHKREQEKIYWRAAKGIF
jgi:5-carboxymethyl-2-hydroxymuconate isomerase